MKQSSTANRKSARGNAASTLPKGAKRMMRSRKLINKSVRKAKGY